MKTFQKPEQFISTDYCFGEVYHFEGKFWAEVIVVRDASEEVSLQSPGFLSRESASAWLAAQRVPVRKTFTTRMSALLNAPLVGRLLRITTHAIAVVRGKPHMA